MAPPTKPSSTENPFLDELDKLSGQELADYFYALAEEIASSPEEYKLKMNLTQLDISELDNIDLSTPAGRQKLAKIFRLLAEQAMKGKEVYQATVVDKTKQTRGR
jgi:hypothetical protein